MENWFKDIKQSDGYTQRETKGHMRYQHIYIDSLREQMEINEVVICSHLNPYKLTSVEVLMEEFKKQVLAKDVSYVSCVISVEYAKSEDTIGCVLHNQEDESETYYDYAYPHLHFHIRCKEEDKDKIKAIDFEFQSTYPNTQRPCLTQNIRTETGYKRYVSDQLEIQLKERIVTPEFRTWTAIKSTENLFVAALKILKKTRAAKRTFRCNLDPLDILPNQGSLGCTEEPLRDPYYVTHIQFFDDS